MSEGTFLTNHMPTCGGEAGVVLRICARMMACLGATWRCGEESAKTFASEGGDCVRKEVGEGGDCGKDNEEGASAFVGFGVDEWCD